MRQEAIDAMDDIHTHINPHMRDGLIRYIDHGIAPGGFMSAVICNDLAGAVGQADHFNLPMIPQMVRWFFMYAPSVCWHSEENMTRWIESGGLAGLNKTDGAEA